MPHLHGKGFPQYECGMCKEDCATWDGIFCDVCASWYHVKCEQLEIQHQEAFRELIETPYLCKSCRSDDKGVFSYARSLERLNKGSKQGIEKLFLYVERERQFMKEDLSYNSARTPKYSCDAQAQSLLQQYNPMEKKTPAKVTKDGNSLFSAVSLALAGTEKLAIELRVRCCIEMLVYDTFYKWQDDYKNLSKCAPEYTESCLNCATLGEDSCLWTMSALATVVRRPIESIYPAVNGKMDMAVSVLNKVFEPRGKVDERENLKIFWSGSKKADLTLGSWVPEVFVPLVEMPVVPMSPTVVSPYLTPSRVSGRVRKPTAKVLAITNPKVKNEMQLVVENTPNEDDGDENFEMPSDFTLEPADEELFLEKYRPEKINLHWMDKYDIVAVGGKPLKGTAFLPAQEVFNELTSATFVCPTIPTGRKEDVFFVVDNTRNMKYKYRRNYFSDDCGRYNQRSGTTCKSFYLLTSNNILQQLIKDKGKFCKESRRVLASVTETPRGRGRPPGRNQRRSRGGASASQRKVTKWIPMEPQPDEDSVVILHRYYSCLDVDPCYKRRICWFSNLPDRVKIGHNLFLVEYITKPVPGLILPASRKGGHSINSTTSKSNPDSDAEIADQATDADTSGQAQDVEMADDSVEESDKMVKDTDQSPDKKTTQAKASQVTDEVSGTDTEELEMSSAV